MMDTSEDRLRVRENCVSMVILRKDDVIGLKFDFIELKLHDKVLLADIAFSKERSDPSLAI